MNCNKTKIKLMLGFKEINYILKNELPANFKILANSVTQTNGFKWYSNGKPIFDKDFKYVLVKENEI